MSPRANADVCTDENEILRVIEAWTAAVEAKNLDAIVADYTEDTVLFDAIPPYKTIGREAIRAAWAACLPYFPDEFQCERRDTTVQVAGDVGLMHCLFHFLPNPPDHPSGQTWMRVTVGYRRINGRWKVVHEHVSVPFNPLTNQTWNISDPDTADAPDYEQPQ